MTDSEILDHLESLGRIGRGHNPVTGRPMAWVYSFVALSPNFPVGEYGVGAYNCGDWEPKSLRELVKEHEKSRRKGNG